MLEKGHKNDRLVLRLHLCQDLLPEDQASAVDAHLLIHRLQESLLQEMQYQRPHLSAQENQALQVH